MDRPSLTLLLGTKGQMVKMAPVMRELDARCIPYIFMHTGQHRGVSEEIIQLFSLRQPDIFLSSKQKDLETMGDMARWLVQCMRRGLRAGKSWFPKRGGIVLMHGDTESTLLGALLARRFSQRIANVQAGLRSGRFLHPFPEEIIRHIVDPLTDVGFVPDEASFQSFSRSHKNARAVATYGNTVFDALNYVIHELPPPAHQRLSADAYALMTFSRKETLYRRSRVRFMLEAVREASFIVPAVYCVLHRHTRHALEKYCLFDTLASLPRVHIIDHFLDYQSFMHAVRSSEFVMTDGGGLQEETWWLDRPCAILRQFTERGDGLGETAYVTGFSLDRVRHFLNHFHSFRRQHAVPSVSPSACIVDTLSEYVF